MFTNYYKSYGISFFLLGTMVWYICIHCIHMSLFLLDALILYDKLMKFPLTGLSFDMEWCDLVLHLLTSTSSGRSTRSTPTNAIVPTTGTTKAARATVQSPCKQTDSPQRFSSLSVFCFFVILFEKEQDYISGPMRTPARKGNNKRKNKQQKRIFYFLALLESISFYTEKLMVFRIKALRKDRATDGTDGWTDRWTGNLVKGG